MTYENQLRDEMRRLVADPPVPADRFTAVERRARGLRRRRTTSLTAVLVLAVAVPAFNVARPQPRPPVSPPLDLTMPRHVLVQTRDDALVELDTVARGASLTQRGAGIGTLRDVRQLPTGEIVGLRGEQLVVIGRSGTRELGRTDDVILGVEPGTFWLVERRDEPVSMDDPHRPFRYGGDRVRRVTLDGELGPELTLPDDTRMAGEVGHGVLGLRLVDFQVEEVTNEPGHRGFSYTDQVDLVVVDRRTGALVRTLGAHAIVEDAAGDWLVWARQQCTETCTGYQVVDRRTGRTRSVPRLDGFSGRSGPRRVSPDGRWLAYWQQSDDEDGTNPSGVILVDLTTGEWRVVDGTAGGEASFVWSGNRLIFEISGHDEIGVYLPETGEYAFAKVPGLETVLGALDVRPSR